jgi:hypothetical protein
MIRNVRPRTRGCEECLKLGDAWVHLRLCLTCGHVGCCDSSKNKHATKHTRSTQSCVPSSPERIGATCRNHAGFLVCPTGRFPTLRESPTTQSRKSLFLCTEVYPRLCGLGCCLARLVARQNDAESANSIEESRPRDAEQDRGPGQLPVGLLKSAEDVGAFRVS